MCLSPWVKQRSEVIAKICMKGLVFQVPVDAAEHRSRHRDMPSGEPDFGEKRRELAKPAQTRGRRFFASFLVATRKDVAFGRENPIQLRGRNPLDKLNKLRVEHPHRRQAQKKTRSRIEHCPKLVTLGQFLLRKRRQDIRP